MSGGGSFGKLGNPITAMISPLSLLNVFGSGGKALAKWDAVGQSSNQAMENVFNVIKGKEEIGAHQNWFGDLAGGGDRLNPMMGGMSEQDRKTNAVNEKAWTDYYRSKFQKGGSASAKPMSADIYKSSETSLLE